MTGSFLEQDSTLPLWMRRKRHKLLQTLPIDGGQDHDTGPDELAPDDFSIAGSFEPNDTLPWIWENDPDATLPYMQGEDIVDSDLEVEAAGTSDIQSGDHSDSSIIQEPRHSRAGRRLQIPARYRE